MDTIFYNGIIRTQDNAYPTCSAVAVKNGVIMRLGGDEEILPLALPETKRIDLAGRLMLPGFIDAHLHLLNYIEFLEQVNLSEARSLRQVRELCAAKVAQAAEKGRWLGGVSFNQDHWDVPKMPTRKDLDEISRDVPIVIRRACFNMSVVNTKGMEMLGIMGEREGLTSMLLGFYDDGTPNGIIRQHSQDVLAKAVTIPGPEELKEMILKACADMAKQGITSVHSEDYINYAVDSSELISRVYKELAAEGNLPLRVYQQCAFRTKEQLKAFLATENKPGAEFGRYKIGPLKVFEDGALGARTACLKDGYQNDPGKKGILIHPKEELYGLFVTAHKNGMQIATHCIGDEALEVTMDTYERVMNEYPRVDPRHGIIHCQLMTRELQERFRQLNIVGYVQPVFIESDMNIVDDCAGSELAKQSYNWRAFIDMGVHICGSSDCPVEAFDILPNICYCVTRAKKDGSKTWYPENGITVDEAVRMFTLEGAYASFEESVKGSITVGKLADLVVIDKDIYTLKPEEIQHAQVEMTVVDGQVIYEKQ
ncbi:MAG: amidohydrolase [Anaerovoracaceae bacterium]